MMKYNVVPWVGNNSKKTHEVKTKEIWKYELQLVTLLFHYCSTVCNKGNILRKDIKNKGNCVFHNFPYFMPTESDDELSKLG